MKIHIVIATSATAIALGLLCFQQYTNPTTTVSQDSASPQTKYDAQPSGNTVRVTSDTPILRSEATAPIVAQPDFQTAVETLLQKPSTSEATRKGFPILMTNWAKTNPLQALAWWHSENRDDLAHQGWRVDDHFYQISFTALAKASLQDAVGSLRAPDTLSGRLAATKAVAIVAAATPAQFDWLIDNPPEGGWTNAQKVLLMTARGDIAQAQTFSQFVDSPDEAAELIPLLKKGYDPNQHPAGQ